MRHVHITSTILSQTALILTVIILGTRLAGALSETYTLRFSDVPPRPPSSPAPSGQRRRPQPIPGSTSRAGNRCGPQACSALNSVSSSPAHQHSVICGSMPTKRFTFWRVSLNSTRRPSLAQHHLGCRALPRWRGARSSTVAMTAPSSSWCRLANASAPQACCRVCHGLAFFWGNRARWGRHTRVSRHVMALPMCVYSADTRTSNTSPCGTVRLGVSIQIRSIFWSIFRSNFPTTGRNTTVYRQVVAVSIEASSKKRTASQVPGCTA